MLVELREELKLIDQAIARLEMLVATCKRRGRPPAWLKAIQPHRGRPKKTSIPPAGKRPQKSATTITLWFSPARIHRGAQHRAGFQVFIHVRSFDDL